MLEEDGQSPHTAHTTNPVPLIVTGEIWLYEAAESFPTSSPRCSTCSKSSSLRR